MSITLRDFGESRLEQRDGRLTLSAPRSFAQAAERIAAAHAAILAAQSRHPATHVPAVVAVRQAEDEVRVVFDCAGALSLTRILEHLAAARHSAPYDAAFAMADGIIATVARANDASPPQHLGALSWDHVVVGPEGHFWMFGWGHNVPLDAPLSPPGHVEPAEMSVGGAPSAASDVYAAFALTQTLVPFTAAPRPLSSALMGQPGAEAEQELVDRIARFAGAVLSGLPHARPKTLGDLLPEYRAFHREMGVEPDPDGLAAFLRRSVAEIRAADARRPSALTVDGARLELAGGVVIELRHRRALRLIVARLLADHAAGDGRSATVDDLRDVGWPDESMQLESGRRRAYVAVSTLRKLGLSALLERTDQGYRLKPTLVVHRRS